MRKRKGLLAALATALAAVLLVAAGLLLYNQHIRANVESATHETLEESLQQQVHNFTSKLEMEEASVRALGAALATSPNIEDIKPTTLLNIAEESAFDYALVANRQGRAISSTGREFDLADREYFQRALAGETLLSEPLESKINAEEIVAIAAPIRYENKVIGVLSVTYLSRDLDKFLLPSFDGVAYAYVTTNEGDIVARSTSAYSITQTDNLFETYATAQFYAYDDFETIQQKVANNESGHAKYLVAGQERVLHYGPLGVNGWNIFVIVPEAVVFSTADSITFSTAVLSMGFVVVFLLLLAAIVFLQRRSMVRLERMAFEDELTGSPTLVKFKLDAQTMLNENPEVKYVLIKLDIDNFKLINQTLGFEVGDMALRSMAKAAEDSASGRRELYGKANIDEFVILHDYRSEEHLHATMQHFKDIFMLDMGEDFKYDVKFVSGLYYMQFENCHDIATAFEKVNVAHRTAKNIGAESCVYDETFIKEALRKKSIENRMEKALQDGEFKLYIQPKYRLADETVAGAEALVRWQEGDKTLEFPGSFIPIFEANGFVTKLDMYMFEQTCRAIRGWLDEGLPVVPVSVNFSRLHLSNPDFVEILCEYSDRYYVPREYLELELTETTIFDNEDILVDMIDRLHERGFTLSMDDFGTGYSSLGLLKNIPVDSIKIDRSFFTTAKSTKRAYTVISNVLRMASELHIHTVAEGVETKEHINLLRELGCDMVQGYYFAKPMPQTEFEKLMQKERDRTKEP